MTVDIFTCILNNLCDSGRNIMIMIVFGKCKIKSVLCVQEQKGKGQQNFPLLHVHLQQRGENKQKLKKKSLKRTQRIMIKYIQQINKLFTAKKKKIIVNSALLLFRFVYNPT